MMTVLMFRGASIILFFGSTATFSGSERLADWGNAVINLMRRAFPDQKKPQEEIWNIAREGTLGFGLRAQR
ncbi:MAG: hypothetical protein Q7U74_16060 [Saprospiraceae bacterium]|nr:hypothetical protein [Saprospiraceae bacterium]